MLGSNFISVFLSISFSHKVKKNRKFVILKIPLPLNFFKTILYFLVALPNLLFAQKDVQNPTFNSYFPVVKLDSLEQILLKTPKNTIKYTDLLLKYEHSHLLMHDVHSPYKTELIALSKKETNPGRKAMFNFLFGWSIVSPEAESQVISVNKALSHFEASSDTAGMVNAYAILVWLNAGPGGAAESTMRAEKYLKKMANLAGKSNDLGVQILNVFYKFGFSEVKESSEQRERQIKHLISQIEAAPAYFPYLKLLLNLQGVLYERAGKYEHALKSYFRVYHQPNQESFSYLVNLTNIGNAYTRLGKNLLGRAYYEKAIAKADLNNAELLGAYQHAYYGLGKTLKESNPIQAAKYLQKAFEIGLKMQVLEDQKRFDDIQAILEQDQAEERYKVITAEKKRIEQQNLQIKGLLGFALLLLIGIGVLAYWFYQLNTRLKNITRSRDKLFTIISHDLRSPLDAYMGMADSVNFLLKTKNYDRLSRMSQEMDINGQKLDLMMTNLFQWSMAELENIKPSFEHQDLIKALLPTLEVYRGIATLKQLNAQIDLPEALYISTDRNLFVTIISNLLDNAIKFCTPNGTVSLLIQKAEQNTSLKVSNDFSLESSPDFTSIEQLINQNKNFTYGEQGMGLGLLLVKEFADALHLTINFRTENQKAIFELQLPQAFSKSIKIGD